MHQIEICTIKVIKVTLTQGITVVTSILFVLVNLGIYIYICCDYLKFKIYLSVEKNEKIYRCEIKPTL